MIWLWLHSNRNSDDIEHAIEEVNEQTENMKQIQEALTTPIGASAEFDEVLFHVTPSVQFLML
jgi:hypothetical protein